MGSSIAQVASSTQPQGRPRGKGSPDQQMQQPQQFQPTQGKGGNVTFPSQDGQPRMGQPNMYPNTVGQWDNASIQPQQPRNSGGKGKG